MRILTTGNRLTFALGAILILGFLGVNLFSFRVSSESMRETLINNELPLTSNNIYSEIQASLLRPIYVSSLMANDTFLKDWMLDGEQDVSKVTKYLREIKDRYNVFSTFVVSDITHRYYHFDGILKQVSREVEKDQWFFSMEQHPANYRVDVDANEAANGQLTIFVNHKIADYRGKFIGVTGLGLDAVAVAGLIERYKRNYDREIYFVDRDGRVTSHGDEHYIYRKSIRNDPAIAPVAEEILSGERGSLSYTRAGGNIFLRYRYIPELQWYLIVEQPEREALRPLRRALHVNLAASLGITLLVMLLSGYTVHRFNSRLEHMARTDKMTGLFSREFFEALYEKAVHGAERHDRALSLLLLDVDRFKGINDRFGHLVGDRVLAEVARVVQARQRATDFACRWGGDELIIVLPDCTNESACSLAEELRKQIKEQVRVPGNEPPVTVSVGVASYRSGQSRQELLEQADTNLYRAKHGGRDQVASSGSSAPANG